MSNFTMSLPDVIKKLKELDDLCGVYEALEELMEEWVESNTEIPSRSGVASIQAIQTVKNQISSTLETYKQSRETWGKLPVDVPVDLTMPARVLAES